jgi:hypothetical protein
VDSLFEDAAAGEQCRRYFQRRHSSAQVLARYARLLDALAA